MKKFFNVFWAAFKGILCVAFLCVCVLVGYLLGMDLDVKNSEGYDKLEAIEYRENFYAKFGLDYNEVRDWCGNTIDDAKLWSSNAVENVKDWFNNTVEDVKAFFTKDEEDEIRVDGAKLSEVASYELCKHTDFTIPYGWTIGKVSGNDPATMEAIMLSKNTITMVISLKNVEAPKDSEALYWAREAMIFDMKTKYSDYVFENLGIMEDKAAIIGITVPNEDITMYMAIVAAGEQTIIVTYQFNRVDFVEGEIYFQVALAEMVENLK